MRIYRFYLILFFFFFGYKIQSQSSIEKYEIGEITVSGNTSFSPLTIITYSGLEKGETISVPGEKLSNAIKKLWGSNLFSSVNVYKKNISDNIIDLEIELFDLAELKKLEINGIKKRKVEDMDDLIKSKDRGKAGFSVPAHGLYLSRIDYPQNIFIDLCT